MQSESVKAFKNELRNYRYRVFHRFELQNKIDEIWYQLGGVRGVDPSREPLHSLPDKDKEYQLRERVEILTAELSLLTKELERVERLLNQMEEPTRSAVKMIYIERQSYIKAARTMNFSTSGLQKRINREMERVLDEI